MNKEHNLLRQIKLVDRQISDLQDYLYEAEAYPAQIEPWPRIKRSVALLLLRRQVMRQIQYLHLRRRMFRNCYAHVYRKEPQNRPPEPAEELAELQRS